MCFLGGDARSKQGKASYLNSDSILGNFKFPSSPPLATAPFTVHVESAQSMDPLSGANEKFVGLTFSSLMDGEGMGEFQRPNYDLAIVLDISGSMSCRFSSTGAGETKLQLAKRCILAIFSFLNDKDRLSILLFNNSTEEFLPPTLKKDLDENAFKTALQEVGPRGGTNLTSG